MQRSLRALVAPVVALALVALTGEEALGHRHAFSEEDLSAHALVVIDHAGEFETDTHYDRATDARHDACPACTLSASPSGPLPSLVALVAPPTPAGRLALADGPALLERAPADAPARGPPAA